MGTIDNRNYQLDNAKGLLIIMVVYAHIISKILGQKPFINQTVWFALNAFHMAGFLMISGFLTRERIEKKEYGKMISKNLLPYLFVQVFFYCLFWATGTVDYFFSTDRFHNFIWLRPESAMWYLFALCVYMVITTLAYSRFPKKMHILFFISLIAALAIGFFQPINYFRLTKIIAFYPYYVVGFMVSKESILEKVNQKRASTALGLAVSILGIAVLSYFKMNYSKEISFKNLALMEPVDYSGIISEALPIPYQILGPITRLALIIVAIAISSGIIIAMPNRKTVFSYIGKYSFYIYFSHWFLLRLVDIMKYKKYHAHIIKNLTDTLNSGYNLFLLGIPLTIALCFILSSKPIRFIERPFLEPRIDLKPLKNRFL